ncbi:MAG: Na/Pi cotransporter family protein [Firmicutes bacterium]|nr:Na/Pi cotransporter family protein [Bacillota bacterium]
MFGVHMMGEGLEKAAGKRLRHILELLTNSPFMGIIVGIGITVLIQSSSATTVMVVSFVDAGLLSLGQAIGVILGANIGTTITAQLVALNLSELALPAISIGFLLFFLARKPREKTFGEVILGFGLIFLGMNIMSSSVEPLRNDPFFYNLMAIMGVHPILGVIIGAIVTGIIQASSATIGMTIALAGQGIIGLPAAMGLVFGSNIGTTVTALVASVGTSLNARRAALIHFLFNTLGAVIFLPFLRPFLTVVQASARDLPRQIANAHTIFNILNTLIFLPFLGRMENLVTTLLPGEEAVLERGLKYIDPRHVSRLPANIALGQVTKEMVRMGELAKSSLEDAMASICEDNNKQVELVEQKEEIIDELETEITAFLATLSQQGLDSSASRRLTGLLHAVNDLERVGDHAYELVRLINTRLNKHTTFSAEARAELNELYQLAIKSLEASLEALRTGNLELAQKVVEWEQQADIMERSYRDKHISRLNEGICAPEAAVVYLDIIGNLGRVIDHANNVAHMVLDDF